MTAKSRCQFTRSGGNSRWIFWNDAQ